MYWKITWLPLIYTSALKIVPLVVRIYSTGFIKCFDIVVFSSFWISPVNCEPNKNITILFTVFIVFFKALNFRFWQIYQSFDFIYGFIRSTLIVCIIVMLYLCCTKWLSELKLEKLAWPVVHRLKNSQHLFWISYQKTCSCLITKVHFGRRMFLWQKSLLKFENVS